MNGIIYCRVSSKEQVEGTSLGSQKEGCNEYAAARKIKILKTFIEEGESAKFADRTQLLELIDFCLWFAKTRSAFKALKLAKLDEESISRRNPLNNSLLGLTTPVWNGRVR